MKDDTTIPVSTVRLLAGWCVLSLLVFGLMLTHTSEPATYLGRYSASYMAALAVVVVITTLSGGIYFLLRIGRLPKIHFPQAAWFGWVVLTVGIILILAAWLFQSSSRHIPAIALFRLYVVVSITGVMIIVLHSTKSVYLPLSIKIRPLLIFGLVVTAAILTVLYLGKTPPSLYYDEPGITNWARAVYRLGETPRYLFPERDPLAASIYIWGTLPIFGFWLELTGVTFTSARLFWVLMGWLATPFIYFTARRLYGDTSALIALAISLLLSLTHDYVRTDTFVGTMVAIALYSYVRGRDSTHWYWHFITGMIAALAVEGHQYGARFVFIFGILYLMDTAQTFRQQHKLDKRIIAFAAGAFAYFFIYIVLHVYVWVQGDLLMVPQTLSNYYATEAGLSGSAGLLQRVSSETVLWFVNYLVLHPVEFVLFTFGIGAALIRRAENDRLLLKLLLSSLLLFFILQSHYNPYYWIHNLPFVAILGGALVAHIARQQHAKTVAPNLMGVSILLAIVASIGVNIHLTATHGQRFDRLIDIGHEIATILPEDVERVSGWQVYFYGLAETTYVNTEAFINYPAETWEEELSVLPPQAVILTRGLDDTHANIHTYIEDSGMQLAYCFESDVFGGQTLLYLFVEDLPDDAPVGCN